MKAGERAIRILRGGIGILCASIVVYLVILGHSREKSADFDLSPAIDVPSTDLVQTIIVPTLDAVLPDGKSAIWCGSFQLAYNELAVKVVGEPIELEGAEDIIDRLNAGDFTEEDLDADSYYAAAGLVKDGILDRIAADMGRRFPHVTLPEFGKGNVAVAFAYLQAAIHFALPYFDEQMPFEDSSGKRTLIHAFGIRQAEIYDMPDLRKQVSVLFADDERGELGEFALDLCRDSAPYQIVVARVRKRYTFEEMLSYIDRKISTRSNQDDQFHISDCFLVPMMSWKIEHRFKELEGPDKRFKNAALRGTYVDRAFQIIEFRLDKGGASLASQAGKAVKLDRPRSFNFNRPYLIYMKKRDARHPFFVMWVDNAELMVK